MLILRNETYLVGDTHSVISVFNILDKIPEKSDIVHMGDFGLGFKNRVADITDLNNLNSKLLEKEQRLLVLRGNHDNPYFWSEIFSKENPYQRIHFLKSYSYGKFLDKKILFVGGGISIDRCYRTLNINYWRDEGTEEVPPSLDKVDIVLSHDAPSYFNHPTETLQRERPIFCALDNKLIAESFAQRDKIDKIVELSKPSEFFSGHFHNEIQEEKRGVKYRCLNCEEIYKLS